ncbi:MAG: YigZ family protein [Bacteroidales bacterium]|jgi:uncharacterized YigZ family protein|nr:YigZ family protein [Bacteroidales bacterium]
MNDNPTPVCDLYNTISRVSEGLYKEKGSRFLSFAYPVSDKEETDGILRKVKKEFFDARHCCFAFRLGPEGNEVRTCDDGEPSYSAGKPILGQILSNDLSDILIVVVRYFGGTKLGLPGLTKAYRTAAANAIKNADIIKKYICRIYTIDFGYGNIDSVLKALGQLNIIPYDRKFDLRCSIKADVRLSLIEKFRESISMIDGANIKEQ